jgi:hypothetical protein
MNKNTIKPLLLAIVSAYAAQAMTVHAEDVKLEKVEIVGTTPLPGVGLPLEKVPANVQSAKGKQIVNQHSNTIADFMNNNMVGVSVNESQNNPF